MKKILLFIFGTILIALGTLINTKTGLGNSAIGSLPFVLSELTDLSLGLVTNIIYAIFIIIQIILLKKIDRTIILQIPVTILFGTLLDLINKIWFIEVNKLYVSYILLFFSITFISLGMYIVLKQKIAYNTPDGLVNALSIKFKLKKGTAKNILDLIVVCISAIVSYIAFGKIIGIGVGTICAVFLIGRGISIFEKLFGGIK